MLQILQVLMYSGIVVVYGGNCGETHLHAIFDYQEPSDDILAILKTTKVISNFNTESYCNSHETCSMYCAMICRQHTCEVYARNGTTCFIHSYSISGELNMKTVDEVWIRKDLSILKGKPTCLGLIIMIDHNCL